MGPLPPWDDVIADGLGQLTRTFGTAPLEPAEGLRILAERQRDIVAANRFGIPAQVHEECLTGLAVWRATVYPSPLCWAASFDPELVERMGARIGATMRRLGIHQGLAPVLDVVRDLRWGRVEETLGEDPYLVGLIGSAYVRGLESERRRGDAQALRSATPRPGRPATSRRSRWARASWPTSSCRRSRWRCGPAPGR